MSGRFGRASHFEEASRNARSRVELNQTERSELTALLSGGKHAVRKLKARASGRWGER
jgi:hypothetical protein